MKKLLPIGFAVLALMLPAASASTLLNLNFDGDAVGARPSGYTSISGATQFVVVDSGWPIPDPFDGTDNKSLLVNKLLSADPIPRVTWGFATTPEATVTFDLYLVKNDTLNSPFFSFFLMEGDNANKRAITLGIGSSGTITITGESVLNATTLIEFNQANTFEIHYYGDQTFTVALNGSLLQTSGGVSTFNFSPTAEFISHVQVTSAWAANQNSRFFIDDIVVTSIPEPSTVAMFGLAAMGGLMLKMRGRKVARRGLLG